MAYQNINKIVISSFLFTVKKNLNTIFFRGWNLLIYSWAMWMIRLWFEQIVRKKTRDTLENFVFFVCFWQFVPFFMPKSKSLQSLFTHLLFFKEQIERFSPAALYKRATGAICSFSRANRSFAHKKRANRSKNRWANYQPWFFLRTLYVLEISSCGSLNPFTKFHKNCLQCTMYRKTLCNSR